MKLNNAGLQLIIAAEGFRNRPYRCLAGRPTIGYGTTVYPDGRRVSMSDPSITREQAMIYKNHDLRTIERDLTASLDVKLSENRFSALVSFVYNVGIGAFRKSTLRKMVNVSPGSPGIRIEFMKYNKVRNPDTQILEVNQGIINRRKKEADLYFL
jgi:lysozyme